MQYYNYWISSNYQYYFRHFDLTFWKKNKKNLSIIYGEFLGRDNDHLRDAFFTFVSKDLEKAREKIPQLKKLSDQNFASICHQFALQFLDHEPANDPRWNPDLGQLSYESNKAIIILSQLKDKLAFYKMLYLFLNYYHLFDKVSNIIHFYINIAIIILLF